MFALKPGNIQTCNTSKLTLLKSNFKYRLQITNEYIKVNINPWLPDSNFRVLKKESA